MSLTMNMVGGGGSGIPGNRAVLVARIPSGSTVTATKGGMTLTPMMWVSETYPDYDIALFVFTPAQFDSTTPWTITATDGTNTASGTVLITANKEYEIELTYYDWLYHQGNTMDAVTGGYEVRGQYFSGSGFTPIAPDIVYQDDKALLTFHSGSGYWRTVNSIDMTNYTTLKALLDITPMTSTNGHIYFGLESLWTATYWGDQLSAHALLRDYAGSTGVTGAVVAVDISSISGNKWVLIGNNYGMDVTVTIHNIWLE